MENSKHPEQFEANKISDSVTEWALREARIGYLFQMDVKGPVITNGLAQYKFFVVSTALHSLLDKTDWIQRFGTPLRVHKADHGFCRIVKVTYAHKLVLHLVFVGMSDNDPCYRFSEMESFEAGMQLVVKKEVF